ncbi:hypothetical protein ILP97_08800 [Amycolatopsis sp. H6(2020)]|nr:hypothetical protein [Amycolatopsis sp. H6(2020)]
MGTTRFDASSAFVSKLALARISEDLMTDPDAREQFIKDPIAWVRTTYKVDPSERDQAFLQDYQQLMEDGNCCKGCGCPPQARVER